MIEEQFDFNKFLKNLAAIDDKINTIIEEYEPKKGLELKTKKSLSYFERNYKQFA